jgi:predicted nucleic-acid-binding Zn-ribbon protein
MAEEPTPAVDPQAEAAAREAEQDERRERQNDLIATYMAERFPVAPPCPWCGDTSYTVGEIVDLYPRDGGVFGPSVYSCFQVICKTCGFVSLFNATIVHLFDKLERTIKGEVIEPPVPAPAPNDPDASAKPTATGESPS